MKHKQGELEGFTPAEVKEIRTAAETYVEARDERMELTKKEVKHQDALLAILKKYKRNAMVVDGLKIEIVSEKEKVKVKRIGGKSGEAPEE